ncbi:hypothetical protein [Agrococcus casei]|uniref:hypothetical protein n=1 Tax=Agrococcus casei TaxID=343512 RepID=UPI003F9014EE
MIIWRGWGILAFIYTLVGLAIGAAIGNAASTDNDSTLMFMGLGGIVGAAGGFAHGWYLNVISPRKKAEAWEAAERPRLQQVAQSGQLVYRNTQPTSAAEADQMIESIIADGRGQFKRAGYHSVFWVPMQWISIVFALICVGILFLGF